LKGNPGTGFPLKIPSRIQGVWNGDVASPF
jgi:hypothetical protein